MLRPVREMPGNDRVHEKAGFVAAMPIGTQQRITRDLTIARDDDQARQVNEGILSVLQCGRIRVNGPDEVELFLRVHDEPP